MILKSPSPSPESVVVLRGVEWDTYVALRDSDDNEHVRMTYNHGTLLLMSPSRLHENVGALLARLVGVWTEEQDIPISSAGSTTLKSTMREQGLEPDECFFIQHESVMRGHHEFDAEIHPPPDLAIEVDVTSMSPVPFPIYAAFGVPEIWRWFDETIEIHELDGAHYKQVKQSRALPGFPFDKAAECLSKRYEVDETALIKSFRRSLSSGG